jgi:hypothetical protein
MFTPDQILNGTYRDPKDHAKWRDAIENVMAHISTTALAPSKEMYDHIVRFVKFGKADAINGLCRELDANKWGFSERIITKLQVYLENEGLGTTAMVSTEEGKASANDAKKVTTTKATAI